MFVQVLVRHEAAVISGACSQMQMCQRTQLSYHLHHIRKSVSEELYFKKVYG